VRPQRRRLDEEDRAAAQVAQDTARRQSGAERILALQQSAGNHAVSGMLSGALQAEGDHPLEEVAPGAFLGDADTTEQTPGVTAPDADAALDTGAGPATATAPVPTDAATAPATTTAPAPADAPPVAAPGSASAAAPAAAAPLVLNHRTDMRAPDGSPDTRTTVAMGEVVYFDVGGQAANWTASAGWPPTRAARTQFAWELPNPGTATITATLPTGETASVDMTVIGPTDLRMRKYDEDTQDAGQAGAGMWLRPRFNPGSVNFGNVEWLEVPGPASGVSGYFADMAAAGTDLSHHPNPDFLRIGPTLNDHAAFLGLDAPYKEGAFHWSIPNRFRRAGTTDPGTMFVTTLQSFRIQVDGRVTVTKQGASVSRAP
jgi:hypothetical protein